MELFIFMELLMEFHGIFDGIPWNFLMEFHGTFHGIPWNFNGILLYIDGIPWNFNGILWKILMEFHRILMEFYQKIPWNKRNNSIEFF